MSIITTCFAGIFGMATVFILTGSLWAGICAMLTVMLSLITIGLMIEKL